MKLINKFPSWFQFTGRGKVDVNNCEASNIRQKYIIKRVRENERNCTRSSKNNNKRNLNLHQQNKLIYPSLHRVMCVCVLSNTYLDFPIGNDFLVPDALCTELAVKCARS